MPKKKKPAHDDELPVFDYCKKKILVMGAGNILFGDDGFGPAVIEELDRRKLPKDLYILDVGSSARGILFNILLSEKIPKVLIIVDSMTKQTAKKRPGTVLEVGLEDLGAEKSDDFQFHYVPTSNMLLDLRDQRGMTVIIIACVVKDIPKEQMFMGLSDPVRAAVPVAADLVIKRAAGLLNKIKRKG
jgi:coenzyme F420 hydrogenase subunit delta